jgi:predicted HAD superfamily hydrolase
MRSDFAAEAAILRPNPAVVPILSELRRRGIRTIAISDTYLGRDEWRSLLQGCGLTLDGICTSAEFWQRDLGKYNGRLFGEVCRLDRSPGDRRRFEEPALVREHPRLPGP